MNVCKTREWSEEERRLISFLSATLRDSGSKRKVFENFANENNFDPLVPKNWYLQSKEKMLASPVKLYCFSPVAFIFIFFWSLILFFPFLFYRMCTELLKAAMATMLRKH